MNQETELSTEFKAKLVAYLDGELGDDDAQSVEETLAQSPAARRELDRLASAWDMLDLLPRAKTTEEFTERTLSSIQAVQNEQRQAQGFFARNARRLTTAALWTVGLLFVAVLGFWSTHRWVPSESDVLVRELPLIQNWDKYAEVGNEAFLRELHSRGVFDEAGPPEK